MPAILMRIRRRGRRSPDKTPRSPLSPGGGGVPRPGGGRGTPAGRSSGPLPSPAVCGRAGVSAAPLGTGEGRAARFRLGRGYLPREEARTPGASMREASGGLDRAPAAAAAPGCAQQPLPRARPRRPPAAPLGAHRSARCLRPAERLRPVQERPAGQSPHTGNLRVADASSVPAVRVGGGRRHVVRQLVAERLGRWAGASVPSAGAKYRQEYWKASSS